MRLTVPIIVVLLASACSGVEYKDSNAAVDANPACVGADGRPGEATAPWCKREVSAEWKAGEGGEKIDFSGADKDD
ncbi:hypothetical protein IP90_03041 [Luteimonas cucumeris]|uniref:Uncharacterized protein n=1 Tax=Luteimonas cucumeris TaxID=985012 RepID=A0A562KX13_9GAMM|nr:hypothetical protein [Luteimonas cucumeris]TWH99733.1 hypothetical protein IP90_03041 [Luteimonas cucumeris]